MPVRWNPFIDLLFLQERMSRIFDEAILKFRGGSGLAGGAWFPPVDIYETDGKIVLKAEIPGVDRDDVTVEVVDNILTLKGHSRPVEGRRQENYHRMERFYGAFHRVFTLPDAVDRDDVNVSIKDGVLKIMVSKMSAPERAIRVPVL